MWLPGQAISKDIVDLFLAVLNHVDVKAELSKRIRVEMDTERTKYSGRNSGGVQSYESLTSGDVNMQARMAASGYDVYGRTIIQSNFNTGNKNLYKKMKNRIHYGKNPQGGYDNRGGYTMM